MSDDTKSNNQPHNAQSSKSCEDSTMGLYSSIISLNMQSFNPSARSQSKWKLPHFRKMVQKGTQSHAVPFIALTETWLKPYITDSQIELKHYNVHRCDRNTRIGGGVLLYTHESIPITEFDKFDNQTCQMLICKCETSRMIICILYRPPEAPLASFKPVLETISSYISGHDNYDLCLLGDFNFPCIDWNTLSIIPGATSITIQCMETFFDFMADHLLSQYILEPTRKDNILDLCLSNSPNLISHVSTCDTAMSDHRITDIMLSYNPCNPSTPSPPDFNDVSFRCFDFNRTDFDSLNANLESINWKQLCELCLPEEFPELMTLVLLQICEICCPRKQLISQGCSSSTKVASRKKRKIQCKLKEAKLNPTTPAARFQALERKLLLAHANIHDAVNKDLQYREMQAVNKIHSNPKYFFSYAKKFSKQKHNISMLFDENKNIATCPKKIANILQRQFNSVFSDLSKTEIESATFDSPPLPSPHVEEMIEFSKEDIMEAIDDIKPSAAAGPDEIPVSLLKNCKNLHAEPIHLIWSNSLSTSMVPDCYKTSLIAPIYKKGSRSIASNYRPVSLTSHIIKIYERVLRKQMIRHLDNNNLLCDNQHGFRAGRSCLTQLLHHFDDILESLGNDTDSDAIYLDFAKAFDKVDHKLLLKGGGGGLFLDFGLKIFLEA